MGDNTPFIDVFALLGMLMLLVVVLVLSLINPVAEADDTRPPGNLIVAITWPEGNTDIDLWLDGPGEIRPVGYSNKSGLLFNLLRDDLGTRPDMTPLNYENAYTRGILAGQYVINVHCYRCPSLPQRVDVEISLKTDDSRKGGLKRLAVTSVELRQTKEEATALAFTLDGKGVIEEGSMNHLFVPLREFRNRGASPP